MHTHLRRMQLFAITYYYHYRTPNDDADRHPPTTNDRPTDLQSSVVIRWVCCWHGMLLFVCCWLAGGARGRSVGGWYCKFVYSHSSTWAKWVSQSLGWIRARSSCKSRSSSSLVLLLLLGNVQSQSVSQSSSLGVFASSSSSVAFRIFDWVDVFRKIHLLTIVRSKCAFEGGGGKCDLIQNQSDPIVNWWMSSN